MVRLQGGLELSPRDERRTLLSQQERPKLKFWGKWQLEYRVDFCPSPLRSVSGPLEGVWETDWLYHKATLASGYCNGML